MLKMKLPMRTGRRGGEEEAAEDGPRGQSQHIHGTVGELHPAQLDKETVFEWFGLHLDPAKRVEFVCGLLHMCQPLELRFIGSCLEDLARKDYHILRDFELRANSPSDLGALTDVTDPVIRSKLLVCLSLLGSDSRECAGILFGILSRIDLLLFCTSPDHCPVPGEPPSPAGSGRTCGLSAGDPAAGALQQLALLFTMASLHPAFHFHQQESIRAQLDKIELRMDERTNGPNAEPDLTCQREEFRPSAVLGLGECTPSHPSCHNRRSSRRAAQREAVHIERIVLKGVSRSRIDKEYNFEVQWSDSSSSSVTKTHLELENFLLKLPKDQCTESFARSILRLLNEGEQHESRDMERNMRESFLSAPPVFKQTRKVCSFFNCDSIYSTKLMCCRCKCQLGKAYHGDCSDGSSQDEESYVHGHKKKHGSKSSCHSAKGSQTETWRGIRGSELSGPAERRKKSCSLRSSQDAAQQLDGEKRSHSVRTQSRAPPTDRDMGKVKVLGAACVSNGCVQPVQLSQGKGRRSRPDTFGDISSESYSSPPSPQRIDSDDDNNKDTDSHSDDSTKATLFTDQTSAVMGNITSVLPLSFPLSSSNHQAQTDVLCPESSTTFPPLSFVKSLPYTLSNGGADNPINSPHSQSFGPEGKSLPATLMMQMPLVPLGVPGPGIMGAAEKREILPTFGIPTLGLHPPMSHTAQSLVQRFNTSLSHSTGGTDGASGSGSAPTAPQPPHEAPVRVLSGMAPGSTSYSSTLQPCQDPVSVTSGMASSLPVLETSHAKHPGINLPFGLPSSYNVPSVPSSAMPTIGGPAATEMPSPGHVQTTVSPDVPTHTTAPAPSSSPALTHSMAHSEYTSYYNSDAGSSAVTPGNPIVQQQQEAPKQQQQPVGCGTCGCYNNCGGRGTMNTNSGVGGAAGCQAPLFFPQHQMAARQVFSISPALFHLTSLSSNSYLTQGQCPHQANSGAATLSAFFPTSPPPAHPSPYGPIHRPLHTHSNSHADVPSHMLGTQAAAAAAAAANYNLQQQMAPAAAFCQRIYQNMYPSSLGLQPAAVGGGGGINKKNGNVSCYNCGMSGHYAHDCSQPSIDSTQQGGFQLKYAASHISEAPDNTD